MTQPPKNGDKVRIKPTKNPVPYPVSLRPKGLTRGKRISPLRKVSEEEEVIWTQWWARRWVHGEIELVEPKKKKTKIKKGGDK